MKRTLAAGPWVGEFGHELFKWQGRLRVIAREFDRVVVSGRTGHQLLYGDFCDAYIPHSYAIGPSSAWVSHQTKPIHPLNINADKHIVPDANIGRGEQEFISYGNVVPSLAYDVVVHARHIELGEHHRLIPSRVRKKESKNWKRRKWHVLAERLHARGLKLCSIGLPDAALKLPYSSDLRGAPLSEVADVLRSSRLAVGESSGPMHFASLCKCSHVVWGLGRLKQRYEKEWNPFNTKAHVIVDKRWNPSVDAVYNECMKMIGDCDGV